MRGGGGKFRRGEPSLKMAETLSKAVESKKMMEGGLGRDSGDGGNPQPAEILVRISQKFTRQAPAPAVRVGGDSV